MTNLTALSLLFSGLSAGLVQALDNACDQTGALSPLALHKHWIMDGWEKRKGGL
jgi:hypothetical protein